MKLVIKALWQLLMTKKNYEELEKNVRMTKSQRTDGEKNNLIEEGKRIGIDEILKTSCTSMKQCYLIV